MAGRDRVGIVSNWPSPDARTFWFQVDRSTDVRVGHYVLVEHPREGSHYLGRICESTAWNPLFDPRGSVMAFMGRGASVANVDEGAMLMCVEVLGYKKGEQVVPPDIAVEPGYPVLRAKEEDVGKFKGEAKIPVEIFEDIHAGLPLSLDLEWAVRSHIFVGGATRSGKSTFILSLVEKALDVSDAPTFLILDKYGEYVGPLSERGSDVWCADYRTLLDPTMLGPRNLALMFDLNPKKKAGECLGRALSLMLERGEPVVDEYDVARIATDSVSPSHRDRVMKEIMSALTRKKEVLRGLFERCAEPADIIGAMRRHKAIVVDLSVDAEISLQQATVAGLLETIMDSAILSRGENFSCMVVVEEAAYYAPEVGGPVFGSPEHTKDLFIRGLSQMGGWNVGFLVCSQRPAYVSKSVISQCGTFVIFKMLSQADHAQVAAAMGLPTNTVSAWVTRLGPHEALLFGDASPMKNLFPVAVRTKIVDYPRKATKSPAEVVREMRMWAEAEKPLANAEIPARQHIREPPLGTHDGLFEEST